MARTAAMATPGVCTFVGPDGGSGVRRRIDSRTAQVGAWACVNLPNREQPRVTPTNRNQGLRGKAIRLQIICVGSCHHTAYSLSA